MSNPDTDERIPPVELTRVENPLYKESVGNVQSAANFVSEAFALPEEYRLRVVILDNQMNTRHTVALGPMMQVDGLQVVQRQVIRASVPQPDPICELPLLRSQGVFTGETSPHNHFAHALMPQVYNHITEGEARAVIFGNGHKIRNGTPPTIADALPEKLSEMQKLERKALDLARQVAQASQAGIFPLLESRVFGYDLYLRINEKYFVLSQILGVGQAGSIGSKLEGFNKKLLEDVVIKTLEGWVQDIERRNKPQSH